MYEIYGLHGGPGTSVVCCQTARADGRTRVGGIVGFGDVSRETSMSLPLRFSLPLRLSYS